MKIKNVIFDLGAVLMNIDYSKTSDAFQTLGYNEFEKMYSQFQANNIFDNLETGHINETDFYDYILKAGGNTSTIEQVTLAWNAMLIDFRLPSLDFLKKLKQTHQLYLLSNTNIIHKDAFDKIFKEQTGYDSLDQFFIKTYYSHKIGLRKPNTEIFEYVLKDAGIKASETLFIDDLSKNIEAAERSGIKTHQLLPNERIEDLDYTAE
ncbi:MAG: HAD family phosphatase [Ferruginibacter sp.]